jgi:Ca-activated chloride channel homolog
MPQLMRCPWCGLLQDEPPGVKTCSRCGGGLEIESPSQVKQHYLGVQMELDQVAAPPGRNIERYLLVTIRTPKQPSDEDALLSQHGRPPLTFSAVLDVSGSMGGEKIVQAKQAVSQALQYLHPGDVFSLVTFSNTVNTPFETTRVSEQTRLAVEQALQSVDAGGMTALCDGLETGIVKALAQVEDTNLVLLLSDGQANVGETDLEKIGSRAYQARRQDCIVSCLGIGEDYNEALLAEIATQGGGRFYHILNAAQIPAYLAGELGEVAALAAKDVKIHVTLPDGATLNSLSAAYPVGQSGNQATVTIGGIPCDCELEIPLRLALLAQPAGSRVSVHGSLTFRSPAGSALECPVNRVTVRYIDPKDFQLREGMVAGVAERIFAQLKAASVLRVSRLIAQRPADEIQQAEVILSNLRNYAELLGEGRAEKEIEAVQEQFATLVDSSVTSKRSVADAHRMIRSSRDFGK